MSTPLYKRLKSRGTSFFAFPSAASDLNLANYNDFYKLNFTKFALLNIPRQLNDVMKFVPKSNDPSDVESGDVPFYSYDPNYTTPTTLSAQLVESLRNYVANYDTTLHESRITSNADFYTIGERYTPTEMIFWKWCRKLNLIDFEPAVHLVDWDKNKSDFDNPNNSTTVHTDYFRKYLWKEREVIYYNTTEFEESSVYMGSSNVYRTPKFKITGIAKFKVGDKVILKSDIITDSTALSGTTYQINMGQEYIVGLVNFDYITKITYLWLDTPFDGGDGLLTATSIYLSYHRLIQYVGEINQIANIQTATRVGQEVTAYIPHQAGKTPTVLFGIRDNTNYFPNLEVPILADEIQTEIIGAESLNSPIRTNPQDYPGSFFGQFDTQDNTYLCSNGDKLRYQGDYYGVLLTDNAGLNANDYIETLDNFNSDAIDGVYLDVNTSHYYKMNIPGLESRNFDEFSSIAIEGQAPDDFDFNAILWYYDIIEIDENNKPNSHVNLYGIEFLNNPDNDDDNYRDLITPYKKLVTNGSQDGLSYMFNLNLHYNIDNDVQPLTYDPSTIYSMFSFDMYNEMMRRFYQVNENFVNIIQEFVRINMDIQDMKSLLFSQEDVDSLKLRMNNMDDLLRLFSTNQFVNSDTATITTDYSGTYPKLKMNVTSVEYDEIKTISLTEVYNYNLSNTGSSSSSYPINLQFAGKMLLNLINDNHTSETGNVLVLMSELKNKQKVEIYIKPDYGLYSQQLYFNMNYMYNNSNSEVNLFSVGLPKDLKTYDIGSPIRSTFDDNYYLNENIYVNCTDVNTGYTWCSTGYTEIVLTEPLFKSGNTIYIQNLYFKDTLYDRVIDYSGPYEVLCRSGLTLTIKLLSSEVRGYQLVGQPRVSFYRGFQVTILRISSDDTIPISEFNKKYDITYKII